MNTLQKSIEKRIATIAKSEKVTKEQLGIISRELLTCILVDREEGLATFDIQPVNKLLGVLTPMNKQTAVLYFSAFLPFPFHAQACKFLSLKKKSKDKALIVAKEFLADEDNNIWTWAADNVKIEAKPVDWVKRITKDVSKALGDENDPLTAKDVLMAVMAGGINAQDLAGLMEVLIQEPTEEPIKEVV